MKNWYKTSQDQSQTTSEEQTFSNSPAPAWGGVPAAGMPSKFIQDPAEASKFQHDIDQWKSDVRTNKIPEMIRDVNTMFQGQLKGTPVTAIPGVIAKEITTRGYFNDPSGKPLDPNLATQIGNLIAKNFMGQTNDPNKLQLDDAGKTDLQSTLINSNDFNQALNQIVQREMPA